jgi:hypothetical protein
MCDTTDHWLDTAESDSAQPLCSTDSNGAFDIFAYSAHAAIDVARVERDDAVGGLCGVIGCMNSAAAVFVRV